MTTAVLVLARTLHIGSAMMLVALPFFILITLRPAFITEAVPAYSSFCATVVRWLWLAWIVEALSGLIWFWFVTAQMSDQSPWQLLDTADLSAALWQTQFGQLWIWRAGMGVFLGVALCVISRMSVAGQPIPSRSYKFILVTGIVLLVTLAWAGHAASGIHYYTLHLVADMLHLLIGAIWPLGLIPMGGFLWYLHKENQPALSDREIKSVHRFSKISLIAVVVLVTTGIINGWLMIGSWTALATTTYGQLLLVKVAVVALMIGLGGFNRFYILPRIQAEPTSLRNLRRTIFAESSLAAVVLLLVGTMGMTAPPS